MKRAELERIPLHSSAMSMVTWASQTLAQHRNGAQLQKGIGDLSRSFLQFENDSLQPESRNRDREKKKHQEKAAARKALVP
jgi:hypothetical protein